MTEFPIEIPWPRPLAQKARVLFLLSAAAPLLLWAATGIRELGYVLEILVLTFWAALLISYEPFTPNSSFGRRRIWLEQERFYTGLARQSAAGYAYSQLAELWIVEGVVQGRKNGRTVAICDPLTTRKQARIVGLQNAAAWASFDIYRIIKLKDAEFCFTRFLQFHHKSRILSAAYRPQLLLELLRRYDGPVCLTISVYLRLKDEIDRLAEELGYRLYRYEQEKLQYLALEKA